MKTGNIGIRNIADIGIADIDVYEVNKLSKNSVFEFKGTVQFYRSKKHSEGKIGKEDNLYTGRFGFDLYNKEHCPKGSNIYYFNLNGQKIEDKNYSDYTCAYLSIWPPKVDKEKSNVILYVKANDDSEILQLLEYECKELNENNKNFNITSTKINIQKLNVENVSGKNFYKINVQCTEPFENDISIIAKYNEKIVGRIIVKANNKVYKTIIQPVVINFSTTISTSIQDIDHDKLIKDTVLYFSENSFNQAYIKGKIADKTHQVTFLKNDFIKNDVIKEFSAQTDGCGNTSKGGLFVNYSGGNYRNATTYNNLVEERYAAFSSGNKEKQQAKENLENAMNNLIIEFKKKFKYSDEHDLNKAKKFYEEKKANNAWKEVKVQEAYNNYLALKEKYRGDVFLDKKNKIYFFINKDIEGGNSVINKAQAYSLSESGVGHIFSSAYNDKDGVSLIIHELGHALGLRHTFTDEIKEEISDNKELIERLENEKKELEKINKNLHLKNYYSLDKKYFLIQSILTDNETKKISIRNFENSFILNLTGSCSYYSNDELVRRTATSAITIENSQLAASDFSIPDEIEKKVKNIEHIKAKNVELTKQVGMITKKSNTLENFMDYRQPDDAICDKMFNDKFQYKSYYNEQWKKMIEVGTENNYLSEIK